jgi:hypothetical protein
MAVGILKGSGAAPLKLSECNARAEYLAVGDKEEIFD